MSTWPPCAMLYDGSFAGFLTCVGESFRQKVYPFYFLSPGVEQISLYPILETPTDQALAKSVYRSLEETVSSTFRRLITYSFLTCLPQRERTMFDLIYLAFHQALPQDLTDDRVLLLTRAFANEHDACVFCTVSEHEAVPRLAETAAMALRARLLELFPGFIHPFLLLFV